MAERSGSSFLKLTTEMHTMNTITSLREQIRTVQTQADEVRRQIQEEATKIEAPEGGLRWRPDGSPWSPHPTIAPLAEQLDALTRTFLGLEGQLRAAKRAAREQAGDRGYVLVVEAIAAGEALDDDEINTVRRRAGKSAEALASDVEFVRAALAAERAALEAEIELPAAVDALTAERRAIGDKGRSLGLQPPFLVGDLTGNILGRHHQLQPLVAEHAKNVARVAAMKTAVRSAPAVAARLGAWRTSGGKVRS